MRKKKQKMIEIPVCVNCNFWAGETNKLGDCRYDPPIAKNIREWPITYSTDWCGKWEKQAK